MRSSFRKGCRIKGFTLIELLVVISIVVVLASILFPVFARARENARRASCMSNMKQLALAVLMYTQDYDERFAPDFYGADFKSPHSTTRYIAGVGNVDWTNIWGSYYPYFKNMQIIMCPSVRAYTNYTSNYAPRYAIPTSRSNVISVGHRSDLQALMTLASIPMASLTCLAAESVVVPSNNRGFSTFGAISHDGSLPELSRHLGGANYAYVDGHVKWLKGEEVTHVYAAQGDSSSKTSAITTDNAAQYPIVFAWKK